MTQNGDIGERGCKNIFEWSTFTRYFRTKKCWMKTLSEIFCPTKYFVRRNILTKYFVRRNILFDEIFRQSIWLSKLALKECVRTMKGKKNWITGLYVYPTSGGWIWSKTSRHYTYKQDLSWQANKRRDKQTEKNLEKSPQKTVKICNEIGQKCD